MMRILLILSFLMLSACQIEQNRIADGFIVQSINQDFCVEEECVYSVKGTISLMKVEYKADNSTINYIEIGQKLKFRYNENRFIEEFIIN